MLKHNFYLNGDMYVLSKLEQSQENYQSTVIA